MDKTSVIHEEIIAAVGEGSQRHGNGSAVVLKDGRILLYWQEFYGGTTDFDAARVCGRISPDGGRTWGERFVVVEKVGQMNTTNPSLLRLRSGNLGFAYAVCHSLADCRHYWCTSADEGQTWDDAVMLTPAELGYHLIHNDRIVQLASGRLLAPVCSVPEYNRDASFRSYCCYSDDEGATWHRGKGDVGLPRRGAMEPVVVERRDTSVLMVIRTQLGDQYRSESYDECDTWTEARPMALVSSESPAIVKRIPATDDLVIIWNHVFAPYRSHFGRMPLTAAISRDHGDTGRMCGIWRQIQSAGIATPAFASMGRRCWFSTIALGLGQPSWSSS